MRSTEAIARHAFKLRPKQPPTRAQRLSATRAAHRVVRRQHEMKVRVDALSDQAFKAVTAKLGREKAPHDEEYNNLLNADPAYKAAEALDKERHRIGTWICLWRDVDRPGYFKKEVFHWKAITLNGRLAFYPGDVPAQVWAITLDRSGVHWFEAEITRITARNVMVRYRGATARLHRRSLFCWWAWWRGVRFVSSRTGRIAAALDEVWWEEFGTAGAPPPAMQMPLDQARQLLGVPRDYTKADVVRAFRRAAMKAHPDQGGTPEMFRVLVEARDRLLAALGTSAPPPKPPDYAPKGVRVGRTSSQQHLGSGTLRLPAS